MRQLVLARTLKPDYLHHLNSMVLGPLGLPLISVPLSQLLPAHVAVERPQLNRGNIRYGDGFYLLLVIANLTANAN